MAINRTKAGTYAVDYYDSLRKQRRKTFDTRKEAEDFEIQVRAAVRRGEYITPSKETVKEIAKQWFERKKQGAYRGSSIRQWRNHVDNFIVNELGSIKLSRMTVEGVQLIEDTMATWSERVGPVTVNKILTTLTAVLDMAQRRRLINTNPARLVERMKIATEDEDGDIVQPDEVYIKAELAKLIAATESGTIKRVFVMVLALLGLRIGEALALAWPAIDLKGGKNAKVNVLLNLGDGDKGQKPVFQPPKKKQSRRAVPLPEELAHELRKWKLKCPVSDGDLVFAMPDGAKYNRKSASKFLDEAIQRAGLGKRLTPHGLRHSFASLLLADGVPVPEVSYLLGHKDPSITLKVYAHFVREETGAVQNLAASILGKGQG